MAAHTHDGVGASVTFGTSGYSASLVSLTLPERTRANIDTTHLGTTVAKTSTPATLVDSGQVSFVFVHDPLLTQMIEAAAETITIEYPLQSGQSSGDTLEFTGFCVSEGGTAFEVDGRMLTNMTFQISGDITAAAGS